MFKSENKIFFNNTKTPFYFYNMEILINTLNNIVEESSKYNYKIHYAMKANVSPEILRCMGQPLEIQ